MDRCSRSRSKEFALILPVQFSGFNQGSAQQFCLKPFISNSLRKEQAAETMVPAALPLFDSAESEDSGGIEVYFRRP